MAAVEEAATLRGLLEERHIDVELFDERLTTVSAHQALAAGGAKERDRRQVVDKAAAAVMLAAWLESTGGRR
jgi:putative Holliday junction resolvase